MKSSSNPCRINGVSLGEVELSLLGEARLTAKLALIDGESGTRFGAHTKVAWSAETWAKVRELVELMEQDALSTLFVGESEAQASGVAPNMPTTDGVPEL